MDPSSSLSLVPYKRKNDEDYFSSSDDEPIQWFKRLKYDDDNDDDDEPFQWIKGLRHDDDDVDEPFQWFNLFDISDHTPLPIVVLNNTRKRNNQNYSYCFVDEPCHYCSNKRPIHDVFLSYSNEDIGKCFISHLKGALQRQGFDVSDHDETSKLLKAIKESWIYVVVFSTQYPFSEKCLDELVLICDSISKSNNDRRRVFPIFYDVDPSHVRSQQDGSFLQAFQNHHDNHVDCERIEKWKHALKDVGNRSGEVFRSGKNQEKFVSKIVKQLGKLKLPPELFYADHPVGIERRAQDLISELKLGDPAPSITAVVGMSGSGKTTLVKAVFDKIVVDFDTSCFIENVRYYKDGNWMLHLRRDVISRFNGVDYGIYNYNVLASSDITKCVRNQKILLVLDDVVEYDQLKALGIRNPASFAPGSRILVTTTNKKSLSGLENYTSYDIELLNESESSELFTRLAYEKGESVDKIFVDEIVDLAGGVPLVLEVWGSYFKSHESKKWPRLLEKLRRIPHENVQGKLKVSYDSLSPRAKNLFLDIACFFDGMFKDDVIKVLEDEDNAFFPDIEIQNLIDKYLVKESKYFLEMHAVIRNMGREVVRQENEDDPGKRSRLVGKDVHRVLRDCSGTDSVRSIMVYDFAWVEHVTGVQLGQAFRKMSNLRFIYWDFNQDDDSGDLVDSDEIILTNDEMMPPLRFKHLKYLESWSFPFKCLDILDMQNVVMITLFNSKQEILWEGFKSLKKLRILRVIDAFKLKRTGSFIGLENLELLDLKGCDNLEELDCSIGCLQKLVTLNLNRCHELKMVPWEMIHKLTSLETLYLQECPNILNIYHQLWNLPNISSITYRLKNTGKLWNLPNISSITYRLKNTGKLWNPSKNFNIISGPTDSYTEVVPDEKLDSMGGTSKGQGEVPAFPKFKHIKVSLIKSHDQNFEWSVHHSLQ